jgi:hypothetical protein
VPQQALYLMNSPFAHDAAVALAAQPGFAGADSRAQVARLYQAVLAREPEPRELELATAFLEGENARGEAHSGDALSPWHRLVQVVLLSNEFVFVD